MNKKKGYVDLKPVQVAIFNVPMKFFGIGAMEVTLEYNVKTENDVPVVTGSAWFRKKGMDIKIRFYKFRVQRCKLDPDSLRGSLFFYLSEDPHFRQNLNQCYNELNDSGIEL